MCVCARVYVTLFKHHTNYFCYIPQKRVLIELKINIKIYKSISLKSIFVPPLIPKTSLNTMDYIMSQNIKFVALSHIGNLTVSQVYSRFNVTKGNAEWMCLAMIYFYLINICVLLPFWFNSL